MRFQGALIKEQGVTFAVVIVKSHVLNSQSTAREAIAAFSPVFNHVPVVLMAQDSYGRPAYLGRPDIARFMANVPLRAVPWKEYSIS